MPAMTDVALSHGTQPIPKDLTSSLGLEGTPNPWLWDLESDIEFSSGPSLGSISPFHRTTPTNGPNAGFSQLFSPGIPSSTWPGALSRSLSPRSLGRDGAQMCVMFLTRIFGSFPAMMLRTETFPPFIHAGCFAEARDRGTPSEALLNCMSIAQIFVSRTKDTKKFVWSTIRMEQERMWLEVCRCADLSFRRTNLFFSTEALMIGSFLLLCKLS